LIEINQKPLPEAAVFDAFFSLMIRLCGCSQKICGHYKNHQGRKTAHGDLVPVK